MYSEQLNQLIAATLADGNLTPKEIEVLCRRAQAMGIDPDEFEVYLEGKLVERRQQLQSQPGSNEALLAQLGRPTPLVSLPKPAPAPPVPAPAPPVPAPAPPAPVAIPAKAEHEAIGKCPSCKETISGLTHVCPSCGLVIDADHDSHGSLEEMIEQQEQLLLQAKAIARFKLAKTGLGLAYLVPAFVLIYLGQWVAAKGHPWLSALLWGMALLTYIWRRADVLGPTPPSSPTFPELLAAFDKNDRQITLFFGEDHKVRQALGTLRTEMQAAEASIAASSGPSPGRVLVRVVLLLPIVVPLLIALVATFWAAGDGATPATPAASPAATAPPSPAAQSAGPTTPAPTAIATPTAYAARQNQRLDSVQALLPLQRYGEVKRGLLELLWNTNRTRTSADKTARKAFEARKKKLNAKLPAQYRLDPGWLTATSTY